jgi:SAM-dependent methyltransferase
MAAPSTGPAQIPDVSGSPADHQPILDVNRTAYDTLASSYKETTYIRQEGAKKWLTQPLPRITATAQPTALDVGCADGAQSRALSALGYAVTGVDFSAQMVSVARELADDPTLPNKPSFLHGEFLTGRYVDELGAEVLLDSAPFDLVLATAFVHLFPPDSDNEALQKVLSYVTPGGDALVSTTAATSSRQGLEPKVGTDGQVAHRWRNHYTIEQFTWLVREAARDVYGAEVPVRPWVAFDPDSEGKIWIDIIVTRPSSSH